MALCFEGKIVNQKEQNVSYLDYLILFWKINVYDS